MTYPVCTYCGVKYDSESLHHLSESCDDHWPVNEREDDSHAVMEAGM